MELDIRKCEVERIRWRDGKGDAGTVRGMDGSSCLVADYANRTTIVKMENVDDLIAALQKYKELYS